MVAKNAMRKFILAWFFATALATVLAAFCVVEWRRSTRGLAHDEGLPALAYYHVSSNPLTWSTQAWIALTSGMVIAVCCVLKTSWLMQGIWGIRNGVKKKKAKVADDGDIEMAVVTQRPDFSGDWILDQVLGDPAAFLSNELNWGWIKIRAARAASFGAQRVTVSIEETGDEVNVGGTYAFLRMTGEIPSERFRADFEGHLEYSIEGRELQVDYSPIEFDKMQSTEGIREIRNEANLTPNMNNFVVSASVSYKDEPDNVTTANIYMTDDRQHIAVEIGKKYDSVYTTYVVHVLKRVAEAKEKTTKKTSKELGNEAAPDVFASEDIAENSDHEKEKTTKKPKGWWNTFQMDEAASAEELGSTPEGIGAENNDEQVSNSDHEKEEEATEKNAKGWWNTFRGDEPASREEFGSTPEGIGVENSDERASTSDNEKEEKATEKKAEGWWNTFRRDESASDEELAENTDERASNTDHEKEKATKKPKGWLNIFRSHESKQKTTEKKAKGLWGMFRASTPEAIGTGSSD